MNLLIRLFVMMTVGFVASHTLGVQDAESSDPIVLMLLIESEEISALQEAVRNEMAMELAADTLLTKSVHSFSSSSLSGKIEEIRQIAVVNQAEVVIWLEKTNENTVSLQLVAAVPGRSMLRSVSSQLSGDAAGELTIAAHEMLKEVQISLIENRTSPDKVASPSSPPPPPSEQREVSSAHSNHDIDSSANRRAYLHVAFVTTGGFNGTSQTPILLGGTFSFGFDWNHGLIAELSFSVFGAPSTDIAGGKRHTVGVRPGLGIGYLWGARFVSVGPYLGLEVPWQTARVSLGDNRVSKDSWWNLRLVPSVDFRFRLNRRILASLRPGLGILIHREIFEGEFSGEDIYVSPYFEWNIVCAIIVRF